MIVLHALKPAIKEVDSIKFEDCHFLGLIFIDTCDCLSFVCLNSSESIFLGINKQLDLIIRSRLKKKQIFEISLQFCVYCFFLDYSNIQEYH